MDWSPVKAGRLATGDCRRNVVVWEPQVGDLPDILFGTRL